MNKSKSRKLALSKETIRALDRDSLGAVNGAWTNVTWTVVTYSVRYCTSRNGCGSLGPEACN